MFNLNLLRFGIDIFVGNAYLMMLRKIKKYVYILVLGISFHCSIVSSDFIKQKDFYKEVFSVHVYFMVAAYTLYYKVLYFIIYFLCRKFRFRFWANISQVNHSWFLF
jgi:hypothetical protein